MTATLYWALRGIWGQNLIAMARVELAGEPYAGHVGLLFPVSDTAFDGSGLFVPVANFCHPVSDYVTGQCRLSFGWLDEFKEREPRVFERINEAIDRCEMIPMPEFVAKLAVNKCAGAVIVCPG